MSSRSRSSVARRTAVMAAAVGLTGSVLASGGSSAASPAAPGSPVTRRVSVSSDETQARATSLHADISANGRYVAFASEAAQLVPGDELGVKDVFVRDRVDKVTRRVSLGMDGAEANDTSNQPSISADGRYVAFTSQATNLVADDTNGEVDVFVRDRETRTTRLVSVASNGDQANGPNVSPSISADGRYVAFETYASNLVPDDTNSRVDVLVRDLVTEATSRVSVNSAGEQGDEASTSPAISADGQYVTFASYATNLGDGVDTNGVLDVYVHDRSANETSRVSVGQGNSEANGESLSPSISVHGRFVAFHSFASNLVADDTNGAFDVFVRDLATNETSRESVGPDGRQVHFYESRFPDISAHGRYVAFESRGTRLVAGDTNKAQDIFVRDRLANVTSRVSVGQHGTQANEWSYGPSISGDGQYVAFTSRARTWSHTTPTACATCSSATGARPSRYVGGVHTSRWSGKPDTAKQLRVEEPHSEAARRIGTADRG